METLHFDFSENATRAYIRDTVLALLPDDVRRGLIESVDATDIGDAHYHDIAAVEAAIAGCGLSERVRSDAAAIYWILAHAEATAHGCDVEQTHFHEVGNGEAIRSTLTICGAIEALDPQRITATPVQTGHGKVECAHGLLDIPAPATAAILKLGIPVASETREGEWCTPTSAAIIRHFVDSFEA